MFPATLTIKAGTIVKFFMSAQSREVHTATFGPQPYLNTLASSYSGPAPAPATIYPSDPPGHIVLTPTSARERVRQHGGAGPGSRHPESRLRRD